MTKEASCPAYREFRAEVGSEAGQRLDDPRIRMAAEAFGDRFVDVFDLAVEIEQLTRQPLDQLGGTGLSGQRDVLLVGQCHCGGRGLGDPGRPGLALPQSWAVTPQQNRHIVPRPHPVCAGPDHGSRNVRRRYAAAAPFDRRPSPSAARTEAENDENTSANSPLNTTPPLQG